MTDIHDSRVGDNHDLRVGDNHNPGLFGSHKPGLTPSFDAGARQRHGQEAVDAGKRLLLGLSASHADPDVAVRDHMRMRNDLPVPDYQVHVHI